MTRGYLILAQDSGDTDYVRMAYALALSIKNTQSTESTVCLATDLTDIPDKYKTAFDHVVPVPWTDQAANSLWKIDNKWKYYYMSPYDETIVLDADMIFSDDISHWWDILSRKEMWVTTKPRTFRGDIITSTRYRPSFESNNLPNIYTAFMYFKKTKMTAELFKLVGIIFNKWNKFYYEFMDETRPTVLSGDVAYALAIRILGIENECTEDLDLLPSFVHMKSYLQGIDEKYLTEDWTQHIPTYFDNNGKFKIGNYNQTLPFHYHVKEWLTDEIVETLERNIK